jgi:hypothetical protein
MSIKTMFLDPNRSIFDQLGVLMGPIDTSKAFKSLKIRFESSTMVFTNVAAFRVAVEDTTMAVEV